VLVTVAEVLPFLVDMVGDCEPAGTPGGKAAILNLLGDLCHQEETTVRDQAVASLNKIGATLSAKDVQTLVVPIALKLARTLEWFTPRVSACGLFALSFKAVADDASAAALRGELRETFKALGIDDAPMVRRSTAGRLAEFAEVLSESMVIEDLLPLYFTLCTDEQDSVPIRPRGPNTRPTLEKRRRRPDPAPPAGPQVRVNALKCTAALCKKVRPQDKIEILDAASKQGVFGKAVSDKSWRVRVACAEGFADVADACKGDGESVMVRPRDASTIRPPPAPHPAPRASIRAPLTAPLLPLLSGAHRDAVQGVAGRPRAGGARRDGAQGGGGGGGGEVAAVYEGDHLPRALQNGEEHRGRPAD